jgi:hypothetical protein
MKSVSAMNRKLACLMILFLLAACDSFQFTNTNTAASEPSPTIMPTPLFGLPTETILGYLARKVGLSSFGGKVFCAYEILDSDQSASNPAIYLWALCEEYYMVGETINKGTGISVPVALYLNKAGDVVEISSHRLPGNGNRYGRDIQAIFPANTWDSIFGKDGKTYNHRAQTLESEVKENAVNYYGIK